MALCALRILICGGMYFLFEIEPGVLDGSDWEGFLPVDGILTSFELVRLV